LGYEPYIISAFSALLGALIPTVATVVIQLQQPHMNRKEKLLMMQKEVFHNYFDSLQSVIDVKVGTAEQQKGALEYFMRVTNRAALYVDSETADKLVNYRDSVFSGDMNKAGHAKFQNGILNLMRKDMGLKSIKRFEIIGNHLTDK